MTGETDRAMWGNPELSLKSPRASGESLLPSPQNRYKDYQTRGTGLTLSLTAGVTLCKLLLSFFFLNGSFSLVLFKVLHILVPYISFFFLSSRVT